MLILGISDQPPPHWWSYSYISIWPGPQYWAEVPISTLKPREIWMNTNIHNYIYIYVYVYQIHTMHVYITQIYKKWSEACDHWPGPQYHSCQQSSKATESSADLALSLDFWQLLRPSNVRWQIFSFNIFLWDRDKKLSHTCFACWWTQVEGQSKR